MQDNKYKQAWEIAYLSGVIVTVILAFVYLFSSRFREEVAELNISLLIAGAVAIWFIFICFVFATVQFYGWVKRRITNKIGGTDGVSEITDKPKNRQVSINITMDSDNFADIISSLRKPVTQKGRKQSEVRRREDKK
ncbi:MAG: hypothetical protein MUO89_08675 [Dehalococcoidia bacterium]|nr:hypothetical protein [Dehalococcoidia bacterium]